MSLSPKTLSLFLFAVLLVLQVPVWFSKGSWSDVREQRKVLEGLRAVNEQKTVRNAQLKADVAGLEDGNAALVERARYVLGMVGKGEYFVQLTQP